MPNIRHVHTNHQAMRFWCSSGAPAERALIIYYNRLHTQSFRAEKSLIKVNCSAFPAVGFVAEMRKLDERFQRLGVRRRQM